MLKEEIAEARNELNKMIENGEKEDKIYKASQRLDELIVRYYNEKENH